MNENQVSELLHRHGDDLPVGSPPHADILRAARRRRGRALVAGAAAAVAAIVLAGLGMGQVVLEGPSPPEADGDVVATNPSDTDDAVVAVPALVGMQIEAARQRLEAAGLRARVVTPVGSACIPTGQVIDQAPTAGSHVPTRSGVTAFVNRHPGGTCGLDLPAVSEDLQRVATSFLRFAEGQHGSIPADTPVEMYIGGKIAKTITPDRQTDPDAWQACPPGGYAERSCPISALAPFADYPGPIAITSRAPSRPCARPAGPPSTLAGHRTVTLTPDEERDCVSYFAVQLFVDDVGQITAVNVVLSEP